MNTSTIPSYTVSYPLKKETQHIKNKTILIFGGSGSLGTNLTTRYIAHNKIIIFSRGENNQWLMKQKFPRNANLEFCIGDIRDIDSVKGCLLRYKPNIIIVAAALKHIDICESNVNECINTNIIGIKNIADTVSMQSLNGLCPYLESVLFVSTDKATSPSNLYGMCKRVSERIISEKSKLGAYPKFINVRYGNVISSNGSIIPYFKNIGISDDFKYFPITNEHMTRYFMTLDQSVDLIEYALLYGISGDTIIPKHIVAHKIIDIARLFSIKYNKDIKVVGIRPGEKLHETLISLTESMRTIDYGDYYAIKRSNIIVKDHVKFNESVTKEFDSYFSCRDIDKEHEKILGL